MINDKKLLCAFIYSAYESGYCGLNLSDQVKREHMSLYSHFIENGKYFPEKEISTTQGKMRNLVNSSSIRDYVYAGHIDVVTQRIEEETKMSLQSAIKSPIIFLPAYRCPVNFYKVIETKKDSIIVKSLSSRDERTLNILKGLEEPIVGNIISGHWNYFLEIVKDTEDFERYKKISESYIRSLQNAIK